MFINSPEEIINHKYVIIVSLLNINNKIRKDYCSFANKDKRVIF